MKTDAGRAPGSAASTPTPAMRQYRDVKEQHPDGILLFRMGDFYEIFFEDAEVAAPIMGITLTSRPLGKSGRSPMCGVPHHAWQVYSVGSCCGGRSGGPVTRWSSATRWRHRRRKGLSAATSRGC